MVASLLFDMKRHPEGVVSVKFEAMESAEACIKVVTTHAQTRSLKAPPNYNVLYVLTLCVSRFGLIIKLYQFYSLAS